MEASKLNATRELIVSGFRDAVDAAILEVSRLEWEIHRGDGMLAEKPDLSGAAGFKFNFDDASSGDVIVAIDFNLLPGLAFRDLEEDAEDAATVQKERLLTALQSTCLQLEAALSKTGARTIQVELVDGPTLRDHEVVELQCDPASEGAESSFKMFVCISAKLLADLQEASAAPFVFPHASDTAGTNLDLVMDVELNVTLRFGQRQLALREVLELASGSVVELDRQVDEPIELILDGKVVARGEAVIIDGNYGIRVTQVLQPMVA